MSRTRRRFPEQALDFPPTPENVERFQRGHIPMPLSIGVHPFEVISPAAKRTYKRLKQKRVRRNAKRALTDIE